MLLSELLHALLVLLSHGIVLELCLLRNTGRALGRALGLGRARLATLDAHIGRGLAILVASVATVDNGVACRAVVALSLRAASAAAV